MKRQIICLRCKKRRQAFLDKLDYCQICYRELLDEYSLYDYKIEKKKIKGTALKICEMLIEEGIEREKIHEILGLHRVYVQQIIKRYTKRVNSQGEERPF